MKASEVYRIWLKASMLPKDKLIEVTIQAATVETLHPRPGQETKAIVLSFVGKVARLVLNQGNANTLFHLGGDDIEAWAGLVVTLRRAQYGRLETVVIEAANGKKPPAP